MKTSSKIQALTCVLLGIYILAPINAMAQINSLNGQTGGAQAFQKDTNLTITSAGNTHQLGWTGVLQPSRGGTGNDNIFQKGSVPFTGNNGIYKQDNQNLFWDNTNNRLGIGTNQPKASLHVSDGGVEIGDNGLGISISGINPNSSTNDIIFHGTAEDTWGSMNFQTQTKMWRK